MRSLLFRTLALTLFAFLSFARLYSQADPPAGVPRVVTMCDKAGSLEGCADWKWNGQNFEYNYGKIQGTGTITRNGPTEVILRRTDTHASWPFKRGEVEYVGTFDTNHSGHGNSKYIVSGMAPFVGTWTASFDPMKPPPPPPPPVVEIGAVPASGNLPLPPGLEECEGDCADPHRRNVGAWYFRGMKGEGNWTQGNKARLIVDRYDANGVVIRREDLTTSVSAGQTGVYTGKLSDGRIEGVATLKRTGPNFEPITKQIPWYATVPTTTCEPGISSEEAMEVGGTAAAFRQMPNALQCLLLAAKQGDGHARTLVGLMYRDGVGTTDPDYEQAKRWLIPAAVQGDFNAQLALQQMYELGVGLKADPAEAAKWRHAADTNPAMLAQVRNHTEAREDQRLMFMGFTSILSAALGPRYVIY